MTYLTPDPILPFPFQCVVACVMVFFTCNTCGASLKKNQVEKHYQNECPRCEVLSCMDCGRDFYGDEYASHTKCISEAEKYQGSAYKESASTGKGERKQQEWLEVRLSEQREEREGGREGGGEV